MTGTFLILAALMLLHHVSSASTPRQLTPSSKYFFSDSHVLPTNNYYDTTNTTVSPLLYNITFAKVMNNTSYSLGMGIQEMYADFSSNAYNFTVSLVVRNIGGFSFNIFSNTMDKLSRMTIRYMIIAPNWIPNSFQWYTLKSSSPISWAATYQLTLTGLPSVNFTGAVSTFFSLTGYDVFSTGPIGYLTLKLQVTRISATSLNVKLLSPSYNTININIGNFSFNCLSYNEGEVNALPVRITIGFFNFRNGQRYTLQATTLQATLKQYNTLLGLACLQLLNNYKWIYFDVSINNNNQIESYVGNDQGFYSFMYMILEAHWCIEATPYLLIANSMCYDICPDGYYSNDVEMICEISLNCSFVNHCIACTLAISQIICQVCDVGYTLSSNDCLSICGDGYIAGTEQCDDNNTLNGDGCSETCLIENEFACDYKVSKSVCVKCLTNTFQSPNKTECLQSNQGGNLTVKAQSYSKTQSYSINLLYILLPLLLILLLCCFVIFCIWRRRKSKQKQVYQANEAQAKNVDQSIAQQSKVIQTNKLQELNEPKETVDLTAPKIKKPNDGGNPNKSVKPKRQTIPLREQTQENAVSLQEFTSYHQPKNSRSNNTTPNQKQIDEGLVVQPIKYTLPLYDRLTKAMKSRGAQKRTEQAPFMTHQELRDAHSESNQTDQKQDKQQRKRGR